MGLMLKHYIDRFAAMEKKANETLAADPAALIGVDSLPGSEHDAKVPEEAKKPDPEVAQGQPPDATTTSGAVAGGDVKPLNEGKLEVDQPLTNPEKKPMIDDNALTAKEASDRLEGLVTELLSDIGDKPTQKSAAIASKADRPAITLDDDTLSKLAAAQVAFEAGRRAATAELSKQASADHVAAARNIIRNTCIKEAQAQGLSDEEAAAAADNAMATAGMGPAAGAAQAPDASALDAAAAEIPEDVTEEELAGAIVDLVNSGELDPNTAKALVEEIAGGSEGAPSAEDQAAEIIAQGLESGEITPEQAKAIAEAVDTGDAMGAVDAEAQGAADAEAAIKDAQDEAQGAADAEAAAIKAASAIRQNAIQKVASAVAKNREAVARRPGAGILAKTAAILQAKKDALDVQQKQASANTEESKYLAGFSKKAAEMGIDPAELAKYILSTKH